MNGRHNAMFLLFFRGYEKGLSCNDLHKMRGGLLSQDHQCRLTYHGLNNIDVPVKPYHVLFIEEILHPFYIFQVTRISPHITIMRLSNFHITLYCIVNYTQPASQPSSFVCDCCTVYSFTYVHLSVVWK